MLWICVNHENLSSRGQVNQEKPGSLVGIRLREERQRLGIRQSDAALLAGVSREMWGKYERGSVPSSTVLLALMGHGFDVNWVLGGTRVLADESTLNEPEQRLIEDFRSTDDEGRAAIQRTARLEALRAITEARS